MIGQDVGKIKYPEPIYSVYAPQIISALQLRKTSAKEHHGPCPNCGGVDRFWISEYQGNLKVNCRQCQDWKEIIQILRERGLYPDKEIISETSGAMNKTPDNVVKLPETPELHPYLTRKRIKQHTGIKKCLYFADTGMAWYRCTALAVGEDVGDDSGEFFQRATAMST